MDLKSKLLKIATTKNIKIELPNTPHEKLNFDHNMIQTVVEFLNTASKLVPDFDRKSENLCFFLDTLSLAGSIKGTHEFVAVSLIKTKLKRNTINLLRGETTIVEITNKLSTSMKGKIVEG